MPTAPVVLGIDKTIARRRGEKIAGKGIYRDPVRSSQACVVKASGLRWVRLRLLTPLPWTTRIWGTGVSDAMVPSERYDQHRSRSSRPCWAAYG